MRLRSTLLAVALLAPLAACDPGGAGPNVYTLDGEWVGSLSGQQLSLDLVQSDGLITGSGTLGATAVTVSGTFLQPDFVLNVTPSGGAMFTLTGEHVDPFGLPRGLNAVANGGGYTNVVFALIYQDP